MPQHYLNVGDVKRSTGLGSTLIEPSLGRQPVAAIFGPFRPWFATFGDDANQDSDSG